MFDPRSKRKTPNLTDQQPKVSQALCHVDVSKACFGKVIMLYDCATESLHLLGDLRPEFVELFGDSVEHSPYEILAKFPSAIERLDERRLFHRSITIPEDLKNAVIVGGGAIFSDGQRLVIGGSSYDFGYIPRGAHELVLTNSSLEVVIDSRSHIR